MQLDTRLPPGRPTTSTLAEEATAENERLTASTATLLLVLLAVEGVTILSIRPLLAIHIVVGMLLIPLVALKLASTGYRFLRYYRGSLAYVAKGPPHILMRSLAPLLVLSTLTVLGSGVALLVLGPGRQSFVLGLQKPGFILLAWRDERARPRLRPPAPAAAPVRWTAGRRADRASRRIATCRCGAGRRHVFARKPVDPPGARA